MSWQWKVFALSSKDMQPDGVVLSGITKASAGLVCLCLASGGRVLLAGTYLAQGSDFLQAEIVYNLEDDLVRCTEQSVNAGRVCRGLHPFS